MRVRFGNSQRGARPLLPEVPEQPCQNPRIPREEQRMLGTAIMSEVIVPHSLDP